ncbi:hypothetical protein NQ318_016346 [Aromia moschata]|uniref:DDE-1 domain-containing protein n=1 Tax=Aromia moschata TaxID=1265417 RepID=A0AAV8Z4L5_9CUCU|nr:hypothetical protein NQ318_016346 [Aromia moschata]
MKAELCDGMSPASGIRMSEKSAYVSSEIFLDWLEPDFMPRKASGRTLLILDGHSSYTTNIETLEFSEQHEIILFCLPRHCTHYMNFWIVPFLKVLRDFIMRRAEEWLKFGKLLGESYVKSATINNVVSAFQATGIFALNPEAIPDYAFL